MQSTHTNPPENLRPSPKWRLMNEAALLFFCALLAALLGTWTRPNGALALFWPANALLLGVFLRKPQFADMHGWSAATAGLFAAGMMSDNSLLTTLWLTSANMLGIATGYLLFQAQATTYSRLVRPGSIVRLLLISACAALAGAVAGAGAAPFIIAQSSSTGFGLWFSNELLNFVTILPIMLTVPHISRWFELLRRLAPSIELSNIRYLLPLLALCASITLSMLIDQPLVMTLLPLPALLWCAARYPAFATSILVLSLCMWLMTSVWSGSLDPSDNKQANLIILVRLLVMFVLLLPLIVSAHRTFQRACQQ